MDCDIQFCLLLISVFQPVVAFNVDPSPWKNLIKNQDTAFGYQVIQKDASSLIVSDPLIQSTDKTRGEVYQCVVKDATCSPVRINVPTEAINMSLGLAMTKDPWSSNLIVCGPTIPKDCKSFTAYNGMCFPINGNMVPSAPIPNTLRDCPSQTDVAFLMDGSGSVSDRDFSAMKEFIITLIQGLQDRGFRFAVAQYSETCAIYGTFSYSPNINAIKAITQFKDITYTGKGINKVVNELFITSARPNANRVLVVITDGQSSYGDDSLYWAAENAQRNKIVRYAIGVGSAFHNARAEQELNLIASDPDYKHVFKVDGFQVLNQIRSTLEANIIAIEGTQTGESIKMEFAQDGFDAAFGPGGNKIMSAVGAFQWKGGYQVSGKDFQMGSTNDSYSGYSMTVAKLLRDTYVVLGAPREQHKGSASVSSLLRERTFKLIPPESQIGSYYGAAVCVVDLSSDGYADLVLVSAPMYNEVDSEGKVFIFSFSYTVPEYKQTLNGMPGQRGRFGMALASPVDLNGDGLMDVVVGAPLEENGQGSIYIFNGRSEDITPIYSQRIIGSPGMRLFGFSLSGSSLDHSGDNLPDLAVGSKGKVTLLRTRPIMSVTTTVTYKPSKIPTNYQECTNPSTNTLRLCFTMTGVNTRSQDLSAKISYTLKLDAKRQSFRGFFSQNNRFLSDKMTLTMETQCIEPSFSIEACPKDALNPLINELSFTFEGLPSKSMNNLEPVLHPNVKNTSDHNLDFEINCGTDNICVDNLKVDFNFSGSSDIKVGIMQDMNVTVFVENRHENSYNGHIILKYPFGFSFRRFTSIQGRMECTSQDSEEKAVLGQTTCYISKPIFRQNTSALFEVTYGINKNINYDRMVTFTATAHSDNDEHAPNNEVFRNKTIDVKYAIYISLIRHDDSSIHINFTAGKNNLVKPVHQILKVANELQDLNFTIFIRVPVKLGDKAIWTENNLQINGCVVDKDEQPTSPDFVAALKKQPEVNCAVAVCRVYKCDTHLIKSGDIFYNISGNVSSGWIEQTKLRSVVFELVSTATMDYDRAKYIYFSSDSLYTAPTVKINTQVEVIEEKFPLKETIGGAVGGLLLLALITAGLYKAGFFKSNYKKMLEEAGGETQGTGETPTAPE